MNTLKNLLLLWAAASIAAGFLWAGIFRYARGPRAEWSARRYRERTPAEHRAEVAP